MDGDGHQGVAFCLDNHRRDLLPSVAHIIIPNSSLQWLLDNITIIIDMFAWINLGKLIQ